jgi:hypothetical protein
MPIILDYEDRQIGFTLVFLSIIVIFYLATLWFAGVL